MDKTKQNLEIDRRINIIQNKIIDLRKKIEGYNKQIYRLRERKK